jgi:hypothetical protein
MVSNVIKGWIYIILIIPVTIWLAFLIQRWLAGREEVKRIHMYNENIRKYGCPTPKDLGGCDVSINK